MIQSAFQTHFAQIPQVQRPRSSFKRVSRHKHTFDEGLLIPFYLDDVLPGDTFNVKASMFARLATPIFPIMDNMYLETFWFYCPNRLVWDNFVKQHGERTNPDDSVDYTTPVIDTIGTPAVGSLWDNFGLPMVRASDQTQISALPFRMYNLIYNDWFRDQDLQDSLTVNVDNGPDPLSDTVVKRIGKFKDYFTTARPSPQKGDAVDLPLAGTAEVWGAQTSSPAALTQNKSPIAAAWMDRATTDGLWIGRLNSDVSAGAPPGGLGLAIVGSLGGSGNLSAPGDIVFMDETTSKAHRAAAEAPFYAKLSTATGPTVNEFREAVTVQQVYELDMRGGSRYIELTFNHFGVINPDFRLQRPEFLGYKRSMVNIHPVPQTGESATTPQGNLAAFGTVSSHANGFVKSFTEHGYVIGLVAVRSDLSYQECVDRHWTRQTRFDYYYPAFSNLGEQAVLNQEIQVNPAASTGNTDVFGYQERAAEYRFKTSKITGLFRSSAAGSLEAWHLAEEFTVVPTLGDTFIQENAPLDRCIAVADEPHFIFDSLVENISARVMPMYANPGLTRI